MNQHGRCWRKLSLGAMTVAVWAGICGAAWAEEAASSGGGGAEAYVLPYALVVLCIGLGVFLVCHSARLRERAKGEHYEAKGIADMMAARSQVPVISVGMRMDQVAKLLGKPKVARRGEEIYRELAQAGKLSEEDAAKEHLIYEHRAGRYELVVLDKRVIQVKSQPRGEES